MWDRKGDNVNDFPEWAGRQVLAEAVRAAGLPWVPWAVWRRPCDSMTYGQRLQAIAVAGAVLDEARRLLPRGVSGEVLGRQEWRDAAWRCIVAAFSLPPREVTPTDHDGAPFVIRRRNGGGQPHAN